ncbi:hypothetical protein CAEBREN_03965 [Caenorhabditis brenneri]|uniref:Uncharacterized protein n=1 Tax=Caenorhabditis brenneri TaxID=135651 RepID=G0NXE4_CAEBE|nr:hypothetical protein CAEBREN_03965 [Caenorhabditis brenneri]
MLSMCRLPISLYNPGNYEDQLRIEDVTRKFFRFREDFVVVILEVVENDEGVQREMFENDEDKEDVDDETELDDADGRMPRTWNWIWKMERTHTMEMSRSPIQMMRKTGMAMKYGQLHVDVESANKEKVVYFWTMKFLLDVQMIERGMTVLEIKYQKIIDEKKDSEYVVNII